MPYLDKLLTAYHAQGLTTPEQIQAARQTEHAAPPAQRTGKVVREQQYTQRKYEETNELPEWMQRKIKELKGDA